MNTAEIRNPAGERLDAALHEAGSQDLVVIGHGVTANKDREWAVQLAAELADARISALRVSWAHGGAFLLGFYGAMIGGMMGNNSCGSNSIIDTRGVSGNGS